ncbi:hypothetical protein ACFX2B_040813 [Malus domestica]
MASGLVMEPVPITSQKHDPAWKHCQMFKIGERVQLKCIYCNKLFKGGGIHRIKEHLAGQKGNASTCLRVPPDVRAQMQQSLDGVVVKKRNRQKLDEEITNINPSPHGEGELIAVQNDVSNGVQLIGVPEPLEHKGLLGNQEGMTSGRSLERRKRGRGKSSCAGHSALVVSNSVALCPPKVNNFVHEAIGRFLYDIGAPPDAVNSVYFQPMIDAIASGGSGVVPPTYHDIRSWILKNSVEEVRNNIDKHREIWGRTGCSVLVDQWNTESGKVLLSFLVYCPEGTIFWESVDASDIINSSDALYELLRRVVEEVGVKDVLQEWMDSLYSKEPGGLEMLDLISSQSFWSSCILIVGLTNPLLRVLRMVGSEKRPAMGYVYAGMYRAKETIKKELVKREEYMIYWNIIDQRWEQQWRSPLHAAGFYLNPKIFYSFEGDMHGDILSHMFDCIERLVPDTKVQDKIIKELNLYKSAAGDFRRKMAIRAKDTLLPAEWWSTYGGGCPNLTRLAIRILSQTCSSIGCRRNEIPFERAHNTRNCLERQRLSDLVFVQYNLRLKQMVDKNSEQDVMDPISFENISMTEDWVTGKDMCLDDNGSFDWMELDSTSASTMLLGPSNDDADDLGSGFYDYEIFSRAKHGEEENVEDNVENH